MFSNVLNFLPFFLRILLLSKTQTNIILPAPICHFVTKFKYLFHLDSSFFCAALLCRSYVQMLTIAVYQMDEMRTCIHYSAFMPNNVARIYCICTALSEQWCIVIIIHSFFSFLVLVVKYFSEQAEMMLLIKLWQNNPGKLII